MKAISSFGQTIRSDEKKRKQLMVFLFFLLLSAFFWLLIKLSDHYTVSYAYPVRLTEAPADQFIQNPESNVLRFAISSSGYNILRINIFNNRKHRFELPLNEIVYRQINDKTYAISTSQLREKLSQQFKLNETEIIFSDNELYFEMEKLTSKVIPVKLVAAINFRKEFDLYDSISYHPKSIEVYGPAKLLDSIQTISTSTLKAEDVFTSFTKKLKVVLPHQSLKTNTSQIEVKVDVARFTEVQFEVPVHSPENLNLKLFPDVVNIYFSVAMRDYSLVKPDHFFVEVDDSRLSERPQYLSLRLANMPEKIKVLRLSPEKVEYLIVNP
ncbi:MAG: CdaR family protein [Bacteroidales bacterium]|jgi:hypothetical protein|nr:CdaR family protein [Bacteroidales bacterium]